MIFTHNGLREGRKVILPPINAERDYPAVFAHLKQFEGHLRPRADQGVHWSNLRNCAYIQDLEKSKIIWGELADSAKFTLDESGYCLNNTVFMMNGQNLPFLLAILNSKAAQWFFELIGTTSGMGTNRWLKYKIEQLPVPEPSQKIEAAVNILVQSVLTAKQNGQPTQADEDKLERLIAAAYNLSPDEIALMADVKASAVDRMPVTSMS